MLKRLRDTFRLRTRLKNLPRDYRLLKIKPYQHIEGWLTPSEAAQLYKLAAQLPAQSNIVEIGSWKGKSTYCLARGLRNSGKVFAIDPFNGEGEAGSAPIYEENAGNIPLYDTFINNMRMFRVLDKIQAMRGYSQDFVGKIPRIGLLFIDGDHSVEAVEFDYTNYASVLMRGGFLAFHDYRVSSEKPGPTWVIDNKVIPSGDYDFVGQYDSLWVAQKR